MTAGVAQEVPEGGRRGVDLGRVRFFAALVFCAGLPALVVGMVFVAAIGGSTEGFDFEQFYRGGQAVLAGRHLYPPKDALLIASAHPYPYIYPPLPAFVVAPLTVLPLEVVRPSDGAVVVVVVAILSLLGVRDWRCYGVVFLWPPVIAAIQTANPTLLFALAAALAWRYRDRTSIESVAIGVTLAVKVVLWPLIPWLVATRRFASAAGALLGLPLWCSFLGGHRLRGDRRLSGPATAPRPGCRSGLLHTRQPRTRPRCVSHVAMCSGSSSA